MSNYETAKKSGPGHDEIDALEEEMIETLTEIRDLISRFSGQRWELKDIAMTNGAHPDEIDNDEARPEGKRALKINDWSVDVHNELVRAIELIPVRYGVEVE